MALIEYIYKKSPVFLQTLFLNVKASQLYFERYGRKFWTLFERFRENQWRSELELIEDQDKEIRSLIKHSYDTVPYYNKMMKDLKLTPVDIKCVEDLEKLTVLTKETIKNNYTSLVSTKFNKSSLRAGHTSGTTGAPLHVFYDIETCVVHHVADWRQKYWAGLEYGQPFATLQGRVIVPLAQKNPPFWRKNFINNQLFLSSFHLKKENIGYYLEKIDKDKIKTIEGYPSTIYILALYLLEKKETLPLKSVLTSSETLFLHQREAIEKAFACRIFDAYGMAERSAFATECDQHSGHHLNLDYGVTEFLDKNSEPVGKGILGRIVATSLHNYAMPLIRYQTNDSCSMKNEVCPCNRGFPLMEDVATKDESIVTLPDGRLISPSVLTHPFKPMENILESQIIQEKRESLTIKIVKKKDYSNKDEEKLISAFKERVGEQVEITIDYVDVIPRTKSGKFKWVISHIKPEF